MTSAKSNLSVHDDEDSDLELEQMYQRFGLPSNNNSTNKTVTVKCDNKQPHHSKEKISYETSIERMETNLHYEDESELPRFEEKQKMDDNVKFVRLEDATEMDVEEFGANLFLKYTENENEPDDLISSEKGAVDGNNDDEEHENYYSCDSESEEEFQEVEEGA